MKHILRVALVLSGLASLSFAATLPISLGFGSTSESYLVVTSATDPIISNPGIKFLAGSGGYNAELNDVAAPNTLAEFGGSKLKLSFTSPGSGFFAINPFSATDTYATFNTATANVGTISITDTDGGGFLAMGLSLVDISFDVARQQLKINAANTPNFSGAPLVPTASSTLPSVNLLLNTLASVAGQERSSINFFIGWNLGNTNYTSLQQALQAIYNRTNHGIVYSAGMYIAPEPSFYGMLAVGLGGLFFFSARRRRS